MAGRDAYDIGREERELKEWRAAKRLELRNEYLREIQNPRQRGAVQDTGLLRFSATRIQLEKLYVPTVRNVIPFFLVLGIIWGSTVLVNRHREEKEHLYRTGQVSYADRVYKIT